MYSLSCLYHCIKLKLINKQMLEKANSVHHVHSVFNMNACVQYVSNILNNQNLSSDSASI